MVLECTNQVGARGRRRRRGAAAARFLQVRPYERVHFLIPEHRRLVLHTFHFIPLNLLQLLTVRIPQVFEFHDHVPRPEVRYVQYGGDFLGGTSSV